VRCVVQVLVYGDCAVNVNPSSKDLAQIAAVSAQTAQAFGIDARVAMLSYSTMGSGAGPDVRRTQLPLPPAFFQPHTRTLVLLFAAQGWPSHVGRVV
jgi:hypothetical protein